MCIPCRRLTLPATDVNWELQPIFVADSNTETSTCQRSRKQGALPSAGQKWGN